MFKLISVCEIKAIYVNKGASNKYHHEWVIFSF